MSTTSVGTRPAAPRPARPWAASITIAVGLSTMSTIAAASRATDTWKNIFEPKRWPSLAPSRMNPETPSPYSTTAVPTVVGGVLKLATIPPMETGMADTLNDISACPMAMTIIGSHEVRTSTSACVGKPGCVAIPFSPPDCVRWDHGLVQPPAPHGRPARSRLGLRDQQIQAQPLRQELGH